jgi:hypothetical protein
MENAKSTPPFFSVEMEDENYPFGELKEAVGDDELVLVHKKLAFQS